MGQEISTTAVTDGKTDEVLSCLFTKRQVNDLLRQFGEVNSLSTRFGGKISLDLRSFPILDSTLNVNNGYHFKLTSGWILPLSLAFSAYTVVSELARLDMLSRALRNVSRVNSETSIEIEVIQEFWVSAKYEIDESMELGTKIPATTVFGVWHPWSDTNRNLAVVSRRIPALILKLRKEINLEENKDPQLAFLVGAAILAPIEIGMVLSKGHWVLGLSLTVATVISLALLPPLAAASEKAAEKPLADINKTLNNVVKLETKFRELFLPISQTFKNPC